MRFPDAISPEAIKAKRYILLHTHSLTDFNPVPDTDEFRTVLQASHFLSNAFEIPDYMIIFRDRTNCMSFYINIVLPIFIINYWKQATARFGLSQNVWSKQHFKMLWAWRTFHSGACFSQIWFLFYIHIVWYLYDTYSVFSFPHSSSVTYPSSKAMEREGLCLFVSYVDDGT